MLRPFLLVRHQRWKGKRCMQVICSWTFLIGLLPILEHAVFGSVGAEVLWLENHGALVALLGVQQLHGLLRGHLNDLCLGGLAGFLAALVLRGLLILLLLIVLLLLVFLVLLLRLGIFLLLLFFLFLCYRNERTKYIMFSAFLLRCRRRRRQRRRRKKRCKLARQQQNTNR